MILLLLLLSAGDAGVNLNDIRIILANGWSTFFNNGKPYYPRSLARNPLDCIILDIWVFDNFTLADKLFANVWQRFTACLLVNNSCVEN